MFKFNFNTSDHNELSTNEVEEEQDEKTFLNWTQPAKHKITDNHLHQFSNYGQVEELKWSDSITLKYLSSSGLNTNFDDQTGSFSPALLTHSDLLPSIYEGGFKIWECTWDLLKYMKESKLNFQNKRVLELGCGAGLPGIAAALEGASVSWQDYNLEVLDFVTIPNILLNCEISQDQNLEICERVKLLNNNFTVYHGDWGNLDKVIKNKFPNLETHSEEVSNGGRTEKEMVEIDSEQNKFDFILTSETIYNRDCQPKLLHLFNNCLKENGLIVLAAKSHYFGVGGGTFEFIRLVNEEGNFDICSTVCHNEGVQREILTLKWKKKL